MSTVAAAGPSQGTDAAYRERPIPPEGGGMDGSGGGKPEAQREARQIIAAVLFCFFLSGGTGLIYEVLWTRMLGLVFGHTVFAITTVLAAFMAGLGLGSYLLGKIADRHAHPLRLYGLLEVGIGVYALLTPVLISKAEAVYIPLYRSLELSFFAFTLAQFLLTFLILVVPTTLMGATLPVLGRFFVREIAALGGQVGRLYAFNTFGAVLGTYLAGFHLLPTLGIRISILLAAIVNIGIGVLAVVFDRHLSHLALQSSVSNPQAGSRTKGQRGSGEEGDGLLRLGRPLGTVMPQRSLSIGIWLAVIGLGVSGAASMMYEVAWTRALALIIGSSTYAFSTMLVTFLAGLALGSYLFSRMARRLSVNPFLFGALQLGIGLTALAVTPFFDRLPEVFLWVFRISQSPGSVKVVQFVISGLAMLLPTLFMGATFPCVAQIAAREIQHVGHDIGRIYFINTGGAIAGTMLAGFLLVPTWGVQATLKLAVSLNLCLALGLFIASTEILRWRRGAAAVVPLLALAILFTGPSWDARAMTSGVHIYGRGLFGILGKADFRQTIAMRDRLLYYKDGVSATISVHAQGGLLYLRVNGKTDASNASDMTTQIMSGHYPFFYRPDAKQALVIGMGSGVTAGAVALHPLKQVDLIEIEPAVIEAGVFFAKENREVLKNPRVRVTVADARNFLLASEGDYDIIISEPSNPWMRGIGSLFSLEFYELVARRLAPKGIVCQWIHVYSLFPEDLKMVINTFRSVFPHTVIWNTIHGDLLLIGGKESLSLDYATLVSKYDSTPGLREDMRRLGYQSPLALLADFTLGEEEAAQFAQHALLNTDDLPLLEFSAPNSLYLDTVDLNRRLLKASRRGEFPPIVGMPEGILRSPEFRRNLALAYWAKDLPEDALAQLDEAVRLDPRHAGSLLQRGMVHLRLNAVLKAEADLKAALRLDSRLVEAHDALAQLYRAQKMWDLAEAHLRKAVALRPEDGKYLGHLADLYREGQRFSQAISQYRAAIAVTPQNPRLWSGLGMAYRGAARHDEALAALRQALSMDPENDLLQYQIGLTHVAARHLSDATIAFQAAALRDPVKPEAHLELGKLYALQGDKPKALESYRQALRLDPSNVIAFRAVEELAASLYGGS
jgi:spermidine synthase